MAGKFPCKDCEKRSVRCHSTCEQYLAEKARQATEQEKKNAVLSFYRDLMDYEITDRAKNKRRVWIKRGKKGW